MAARDGVMKGNPPPRLNQNLINNMPMHIREPVVAALEAVGQAGVVDP